jgi:aconitate hydratase
MTFSSQKFLTALSGTRYKFFSLPALESAGVGKTDRLPVSIRIVLESVLRTWDNKKVTEEDIVALATWQGTAERTREVPFTVARVLLQDFTGVPLGVDLAAMRTAMQAAGHNPALIEPLVPVDLVIDHSVQVDYAGIQNAFERNLEKEFERNQPRYEFLKWCQQTFQSFGVIPPGVGICHQVNLEYLAQGIMEKDGVLYPDTLVGTDSHTTMINGVGVVGWGVGGIEAEAAMLGQPVYFLTPDVVGVHLSGTLTEGTTATDLVLRVTQLLREAKVVGKFVEFHGEGAASLPVPDRATISNMAPEYGATMGFFPFDERTCDYFIATGREKAHVDLVKLYLTAQGLFGIPRKDECEYSQVLELDLTTIEPSVAGPKRPQDRISLAATKKTFQSLMTAPKAQGGFEIPPAHQSRRYVIPQLSSAERGENASLNNREIAHGDVVIAAITSCTNTSNPSVMIAAGLVAKKAIERGLSLKPTVKASLAPGSRVVSEYLESTGLQPYLDKLGFNLVGYGCTTCIGNSGPLHPELEQAITTDDLVVASVLSGNRNFEARIHQNIKANFLMSPPLVVAYALAGSVTVDLSTEPLGTDPKGQPVYLRDIWPTLEEVSTLAQKAYDPEVYRRLYSDAANQSEPWNEIPERTSMVYPWDEESTYIQEPPYFNNFSMKVGEPGDILNAYCLGLFGDSVTTDHISPAGAIKKDSPAGRYLLSHGVPVEDFNSYGSRRGNHEVMVRGTFANVRIRNLMIPGSEGGITIHVPTGEQMSIYDASLRYHATQQTPLIVLAGSEYGTGSSRDWAAKGTQLLGVQAVIAKSFERIHRSNLIGMGVLPCQFLDPQAPENLGLTGKERFSILGISGELTPKKQLTLRIIADNGVPKDIPILARLDTLIEVDYYIHGGILPYVLREIIRKERT